MFRFNNKTTFTWKAEIWIDGRKTSDHGLVLYPGETHNLERFIDSPNRFKFVTYNADKQNESYFQDMGDIEIRFFREWIRIPEPTTWIMPSPHHHFHYDGGTGFQSTSDAYLVNNCTNTDMMSYTSSVGHLEVSMSMPNEKMDSIEVGKTIEGSHSEQTFDVVNLNFESTYTSVYLKIKPLSQLDTQRPAAIYCSQCSRRFRTKEKYCPECGNKKE